MEQAIYIVIGAALTWAFYFVRRRVERSHTSEVIDRNARLLALKQELDGSNTNLDDLRRFEHRLIGKAETAARIADNYFSKAEEVARQGDAAADAVDINQHAIDEFRRADQRLIGLVAHLRRQLDGDSLVAFEDAHRSWLEFRDRHARFISQSYAGGPIRPLIQAVTLENLTESWIAELESQLGDDA